MNAGKSGKIGLSSVQSLAVVLTLALIVVSIAYVNSVNTNLTEISSLQNKVSQLQTQLGINSSELASLQNQVLSVTKGVSSLEDEYWSLPVMNQSTTDRNIWVQWEETQSGQDRFSPYFIIVNQGDTVHLTFINNDTVAHDFVIGEPYDIIINASVPGLYNDLTGREFTTSALHNSPGVRVVGRPGNVTATYTFVAKYPGIYEFVCTYHVQVGMFGYLVVLPNAASNATPVTTSLTQNGYSTNVLITKGAAVNESSQGYFPARITVVIGVNNTVTWTNTDTAPHTVTALDGSFNSGNLNPGDSFTYTFRTPGTYAYFCEYHPWMKGVIIVEP
jgi:plastocyanin